MEKYKKNSILNRDSSVLREKIAEMNEKYRLQMEKETREQAELEEFYKLEEEKKALPQFFEEPEFQLDESKEEHQNSDTPFFSHSDSDFETFQDLNQNKNLDESNFIQKDFGINNVHERKSVSKKISIFVSSNKYLLSVIPFLFLILFFASSSLSHTGNIKKSDFSYIGRIQNDVPNGTGTINYANGDTYIGYFFNGKFSGQGVFSSKLGKWTYSGLFNEGLPDGKGVLTTPDGKHHPETFKNGALSQ
ncbi:MAG TPA: hypothetical protein VGC17_00990 [Lactovum miscens]|uniref:hypothetical protein n=1 Tax=Lactovum miscens TaxID=190387 RepID=UPI002EDB1523